MQDRQSIEVFACGPRWVCIDIITKCISHSPLLEDRLKAGAGTAVETAGELTGDDTVGAVAGAAANQIATDGDAPVEERLAMLGGDAVGAANDSGLLGDVIGQIASNVGEVIADNAEHIGKAGEKLRGKEEEEES